MLINKRIHIVILTLVLLLCPFGISAQDFCFKHVGLAEGLSSSQVNAIYKDSKGFVWFGTSDGLNRYDGFYIQQFQSNYQKASALPDSYITSVQEAGDGIIWIKTNGGYVAHDPASQNFDRSVAQRLSMLDANINPDVIYFDHWKNMWVYDKDKALYYYKAKQQLVYTLRFDDEHVGLRKGTITGLFEVTDGVLAVYTDGTVCCVSGEQQKVLWYNEVIARNTSLEDNYQVFGDSDGNIWVYGDAHSYYYDRSMQRWYRSIAELLSVWGGDATFNNTIVTGVAQAADGKMWVSTDRNGLLLLDARQHTVVAHIQAGGDRGLLSDQLETVYVDDTGLLWTGSHRSGVSYYAPNLYLFDILALGDVYGMCEDKHGGLWFATHDQGLIYRNPMDGYTTTYTTAQGLNDNVLSCVLCASDGTIWVGSNRFGLNSISSHGVKVMQATTSGQVGLKDNNIQALAEDAQHNIWIGTRKGGLQCYNPRSGTFSNFSVQNGKLLSDNVTSLYCRGNQLVAGTTNGMMMLNMSNNKAKVYAGTESGDKHFSSSVITQVFIDSRGLVWIGTREGINVFDVSTDQLVSFNTSHGLGSNVICGISEDANHEVWLTTAKGVNRVAVQEAASEHSRFTFNFYGYTVHDGLQGVEFNMGSIMSTHSGKIIMGGPNGVNWIRNIKPVERKRRLGVFLSRLFVGDQPVEVGVTYSSGVILRASLNSLSKLQLLQRDKEISFSLGVDDYNHAEPARFTYQLEGLSDLWNPVSGDGHTLTLPPLSSGTYKLHVKALLDDGKTVSEEHVLIIEVKLPWYKSWWLILVVGVVVIILGILIARIWPILVRYYRERRAEIASLKKRQDELDVISRGLRTSVVSMIPQLGLLQMEATDAKDKEVLNGLHHTARQMLSDLNRLKDNTTLVVNDVGVDTGASDAAELLIGDDGAVDAEGVVEDFLVSDEGIITASGAPVGGQNTIRDVVFVVEPDADMLEFVADCLKSTFVIYSFTTAEDCWNKISEVRPNLIMCAENLSGMLGSAFCEQIKNERSLERVPFILTVDGVLTQAELSMKKITLLADDYIPSPYNLQTVIVRMNRLLGKPNEESVAIDDTMRGANAMQDAANLSLCQLLDQYIRQNIGRKELSIEEMGRVLGVSRTVLFRKIELVTKLSPTEYIRSIRLQESAKLLESGYVTPAEVAQELGFGNLATFSRFFQSEYGVLPSEYAEGKRGNRK